MKHSRIAASSDDEIYSKYFKIKHNRDSFDYLIEQIKKAEKELNMKTAIFMKSTGVYHLTIFHFLKNNYWLLLVSLS